MCGFDYRLGQIDRGRRSFLTKPLKNFRWAKTLIKDRKPSNLTIYNGGSFLNDEEIPRDVQEKICEEVSESPCVDSLFVESRPEFLSQEIVVLGISVLKNVGTKSDPSF